MKALLALVHFMIARRLLFPALLFCINLACAITAFQARDWKRGVYWLSSAVCIAMVSV
ncbi:MAG TPA: hypothetical protein VKV15_07110 [Bryobacteraceae bacterium]|nr:hypothetical protein [Bryobacteraceae bacterium]